MSNSPLHEKVRVLIARALSIDVSCVGEDASPDVLPAWDSLHHANILFSIDDEFGIRLSPATMAQMIDFKSITRELEQTLSGLPKSPDAHEANVE